MKSVVSAAVLASQALSIAFNESRTWEEMLPCRDGVKLHTRIVMPKDDNGGKYTAIIDRSPYGYTDLEWIPDIFLPGGFATVSFSLKHYIILF